MTDLLIAPAPSLAGDVEVAVTPSPAPAASDTERVAGAHRRAFAWLFAGVLLGRLAFAVTAFTSTWRISYDEPAELAIARYLGGGGRWMLFHAPAYQPGVGLLLSPVAALGASSATTFHAAVVANCLIAAASAVVLAGLLRRVGVATRRVAAGVAALVALAPAVVPLSAHAWGDPAVTLTFLVAVRCLIELVDATTTRWAAGAVGAASVGYLFHGRMLPAVAATVAICLAVAIRARRPSIAGAALACAAVGWATVRGVAALLADRLWQVTSDTNSAGGTLKRLGDPIAVAESLVGQAWYQVVATAGLAAVGAAVLLAALVGRGPNRVGLTRRYGIVVAAMALAMVATSVVFMSAREGAHFLVYGRYNDDALWVVVALGAVEVWSRRADVAALLRVGLALPLGALAGLTAAVVALHGGTLPGESVDEMVNGIVALSGSGSIQPVAVAAVAAVALSLVMLTLIGAPARPQLAVAMAAVLVTLGGAHVFSTRMGLTPTEFVDAIAEVDDVVPAGADIGYRFTYSGYFEDPDQVARLAQNYQYWLTGHQFVLVTNVDPAPEYTLSVRDDPHMVGIATIVWSDVTLPHVLWRLDDVAVNRPPGTN